MATAKVGDVNIYYESQGDGEALLLIMGYGAYSAMWGLQIPSFSQEYRVISFDNRGTGQSDKPDTPYTIKMMADDARGLLDAIGIDSAHVCGVSMGGMIAQELALNYPDRVKSLILGCTFCGGAKAVPPAPEVQALLAGIGELPLEEQARVMMPLLWTQEFIDKNPVAVEIYVAITLKYPTPAHGFARQAEAIMFHDTYERLPQIAAPTLVITGDADRIIPADNSKILASRIPNAELVVLKNAGHGFFGELVEETNGIILNFLGRHSKGKKAT
jgi:pimeloyl-ACP methyl ester carboxylesterase